MSILVIVPYVLVSCLKVSLSYIKDDNPLKNSAKIARMAFFQYKVNFYKSVLSKFYKLINISAYISISII